MLLYDLTSTYFEWDPPDDESDKRRYGYSRDKRPDCVQVVIALVVTPDGFPLAYEVMPGNTSDKTTLRGFLAQDRGALRQGPPRLGDGPRHPDRGGARGDAASDPPVDYLVGTPKGRLGKFEKELVGRPGRRCGRGWR